jgi:hypothetical protein
MNQEDGIKGMLSKANPKLKDIFKKTENKINQKDDPHLAVRLKMVTEKPASRIWPHIACPITPVPIHLHHHPPPSELKFPTLPVLTKLQLIT